MPYHLISRNVDESCNRVLDIAHNAQNCSGFVRAVADDLMLFVPGLSGVADDQVSTMSIFTSIRGSPRLFFGLGRGRQAEDKAVAAAARGGFVVCGMTSAELQTNRKFRVQNGHVAIVVGGRGPTGWPLAWWGQKDGIPGRRESLSKCFRAADRPSIHYYLYLV